jgi:hypothetical protein
MEYVEKHYPEKCWVGFYPEVCRILPLKFSNAVPLSKLNTFHHTSQIEYLSVATEFNTPNEGGWDDYENTLALCPNLKGIIILEIKGEQSIDLISSEYITSENQHIWNERIAYLNSLNIEVITVEKYRQLQLNNHPKKPVFVFLPKN